MLEGIGKVESEVIDHHGLVAATCEEAELAQQIDRRLGKTKRIVSFGKACVAMVLNGLGFTNRRLYLTPQFFANKAVENLLGTGIRAEHINDDALGDTLDAIAAYGPSKLYAEVAHEIALKKDLLHGPIHVDTTSFSVTGESAIDEDRTVSGQAPAAKAIKLTYGFSKDRRPDLKQAVLSLAMVHDSEIPLWMTACDGNASDKKTLQKTIEMVQAFRRSLEMNDAPHWIADSSLYTAENLVKMKDIVWVSRVPETLAEAKSLVGKPDQAMTWTIGENGYKTAAFHSNHAGIGQRWLLVFSEQAYRREEKTLYKNVEKQAHSLQQTLWHLGNEVFQCENDAQKAFEKQQQKTGALFTLTARIVPVEKYAPTPTLRWIFQLMEEIAVVKIADQANTCWQTTVTNLDKLRQKIVRLFGLQACRIYQISEFP